MRGAIFSETVPCNYIYCYFYHELLKHVLVVIIGCVLIRGINYFAFLEQGNPIRLVGGAVHSEGRLEIYYGGQWGTVCSAYFSLADGYVACRQLGYANVLKISTGPSVATNRSILLSNVLCHGYESSLLQCSPTTGTIVCTPLQNTWLVCGKQDKN